MKVFEKLDKKETRKRELKKQRDAAAAAAAAASLLNLNGSNNYNVNTNGVSVNGNSEEKELIWQAKVIKEPKYSMLNKNKNNQIKLTNNTNSNDLNVNNVSSPLKQEISNNENNNNLDINNNNKKLIDCCTSIATPTIETSTSEVNNLKFMTNSDKKFNEPTSSNQQQNLHGLMVTNDEILNKKVKKKNEKTKEFSLNYY